MYPAKKSLNAVDPELLASMARKDKARSERRIQAYNAKYKKIGGSNN